MSGLREGFSFYFNYKCSKRLGDVSNRTSSTEAVATHDPALCGRVPSEALPGSGRSSPLMHHVQREELKVVLVIEPGADKIIEPNTTTRIRNVV